MHLNIQLPKKILIFPINSNRSIIHKRLLIIIHIRGHILMLLMIRKRALIVFRFQDFENRGNIYPDSLTDIVKLKKFKIPTPKSHQTELKNDVVQKFKKCSKGQQVKLACGIVKNIPFFWIHKDYKYKENIGTCAFP